MRLHRSVPRLATATVFAMLCLADLAVAQDDPAAPQDVVNLVGGDTIHGRITESTDDHVIIQHANLGQMTIARDQIASINPPPPPPALPAAPDTSWKSKFKLAGSGTYGNTDNQKLNVGISTRRDTEQTNTLFKVDYFYGARDGDQSENRVSALGRNDWLLPDSRWLYFAQGTYDFDEFKTWEHRVGTHAGLGYQWIDEEDLSVNLRAGAGGTKEWGSDDDDFRPEGFLGGDLTWDMNETQDLSAAFTIFPDLDDGGEFRTVTTVDWSVLLDSESNMSLTAGLLHEYDSEVDPGFKHYDLKIFVGLTFDF